MTEHTHKQVAVDRKFDSSTSDVGFMGDTDNLSLPILFHRVLKAADHKIGAAGHGKDNTKVRKAFKNCSQLTSSCLSKIL